MSLTIEDRQQIQDLMIRYAFAVDKGGSEDDFLKIFTPDAILDGPGGRHEGVQGVKDFARRVAGHKGYQLRHLITNFLIEGDGDHATLEAYFVEYLTAKNRIRDIGESEVLYVGTYDCAAQKLDGVWRLQKRLVEVDAE